MTGDRPLAREIHRLAFAAIAVFLVAGAFTRQPHAFALSLAGCAIALAAAVPLPLRGPRLAVAMALLAGFGVALDAGAHCSGVAWFGFCLLAFWLPIATGPRAALLWLGAAEALLIGHMLTPHFEFGWLPWIAGVAISAGGAFLLVHEQELISQLRAAQAGLAERSRAEERNRIARDLHDVIAHSLTVTLLHISSARLSIKEDPADAERALEQAERLGRQSLEEVRSIVGLMRSSRGGGSPGVAPMPGLEGLEDLVERFRNAGAEVSYERLGEVETVPATAGATLYRIAQEAFTNAAKHAPGAPLSVQLAGTDAEVELIVDSAGEAGRGRGTGLASMRERAEALGGSCEAGPAGGGWRVRAAIPVRAAV